MDWQNLIVQLGISGLVVYVVFRIGMKLIENMRITDSERTEAIRQGFAADIRAHDAIVNTMTALGSHFSRVEGKLDTMLDLTPVREMRRVTQEDIASDARDAIPKRKIPSVMVDIDQLDEDDTPVDRHGAQSKTPKPQRASSVAGIYGPKKP